MANRDLRLNPPIPALHPERDALLAAVRDAPPDDDLPALVYADWQDEHGQPEHAELIRVMVELAKARKQDRASKERRPKLLARMKELFKTPALKPLRELESDTWKFSRGFVRDMTFWVVDRRAPRSRDRREVPAAELADLPAVVPFDKLAWLGVELPDEPTAEHAAALAAVPWFGRVDRLELTAYYRSHLPPGLLIPLAASKYLGGLRTIELRETGLIRTGWIAASELAELVLAKSATGLRRFPLAQARLACTDGTSRRRSAPAFLAAVERIVTSKRARQFTSFGEEVADVDEALAKILLASKHLTGIRTFRYVFLKVTAKTQAAFVERFGQPERVD